MIRTSDPDGDRAGRGGGPADAKCVARSVNARTTEKTFQVTITQLRREAEIELWGCFCIRRLSLDAYHIGTK